MSVDYRAVAYTLRGAPIPFSKATLYRWAK
jgi:hypothetical protein